MNEKRINDEIDKTHFKTFKHIKSHVKRKYPHTSKKKIKEVVSKRLKDKFINKIK